MSRYALSSLRRTAKKHGQIAFANKSTVPNNTLAIFDRETKRKQRDWAAVQSDFDRAQSIKDEIAYRVADRVYDLTRFNDVCLDLGSGPGYIAPHLIKENIGLLIQCDMSKEMLAMSKEVPDIEVPTLRVVADEEMVPFRSHSIDLILSCLSAHWINDLPRWFGRCLEILREDGCLIGTMFAGDTLQELRISLQLAESERLGGVGQHVSPFVDPPDIVTLMNRVGFAMVTIDLDEVEVEYPNMFALMYDLQLMAESNATFNRSPSLRRDILLAADSIYKKLFATEGQYLATFQFVSFIGWRPSPNMPKPAKRGSQNISFKDISKLVELHHDKQ